MVQIILNQKVRRFDDSDHYSSEYFNSIADILKYFLKEASSSLHPNLDTEFEQTSVHFRDLVMRFPDAVKSDKRKLIWLELIKRGLLENENEAVKSSVELTILDLVTNPKLDSDVFE